MNLDDLLSRLDRAKPHGSSFMARCPAHPDKNPSLSVSEGQDGRPLLKCFAGCDTEAIVTAMGLTMKDLMPDRDGRDAPRNEGRRSLPPGAGPAGTSAPKSAEDPAKNWIWKTQDEALAAYAALPRAADDPDAAAFFRREYALGDAAIPDAWRLFDHPRLGPGVVYTGHAKDKSLVFAYRSFERNEKDKREQRFLHGNEGAFILAGPEDAPLVVVGGAEKAAAAHAAGYSALCFLSGEKALDAEWAAKLAAMDPPSIIFAHDHDDTGLKANQGSAAALDEAGFDPGRIRIVNWPEDTQPGGDLNDAMKAGGVDAVKGLLEAAAPYVSPTPPLPCKSVTAILSTPTSNADLIGDCVIQAGALSLFVGPPGLGKSRLVFQLGIDLAIGAPHWLGESLPIQGGPRRVLILQLENGVRRLQTDFHRLSWGRTPEDLDCLDANLLVLDPSAEPLDLGLDGAAAIVRIRRTVKVFRPDLVILDPWTAFYVGEDENQAVATRNSLRLLRKALEPVPRAAILIVHHARTGRTAAAGGEGWDSGAYARGSKALMGAARAQINLVPGDAEGEVLVVTCGKNNDGRKFQPFAVRYDSGIGRYAVEQDFDLDQWRTDVHASKPARRPKSDPVNVADVLRALNSPHVQKSELADAYRRAKECAPSTAYAAIAAAIKSGAVVEIGNTIALPLEGR